MGVARSDEARDASRRTRLASERTYLAWWRTGLTTLAVSLAAGKLVPELSTGAAWPFEAIGIAFALVGLVFIRLWAQPPGVPNFGRNQLPAALKYAEPRAELPLRDERAGRPDDAPVAAVLDHVLAQNLPGLAVA